MKEAMAILGFIAAMGIGFIVFLYLKGKKERKKNDNWEQKRRAERKKAKSDKEYEEFLKANLSVPGVTKSSDFHKKYSNKKRYKKAPK